MPVLTIEGLSVAFGDVPVVQDLSLSIKRGETLALVGESGSGKSLTALAVMGLLPRRARRTEGRILLGGTDISLLDENGLCSIRGARIGMIFQEPMTSLTPVLTVERQMTEALVVHKGLSMSEARSRALDMLTRAGITEVERRMRQYPHEFSGGMRQRVMIAMALICGPALLIADEPTTALDVTIQAQILKLLRDLQAEMDMAILLVTHDLGVVANIADEVVVIYQGEIMEAGPVDTIFRKPEHPYLKGLMAAIPHFGMKRGDRLKPLREIEVNQENLLGKKFQARSGPDIILKVDNLSKTFETRKDNWKLPGFAREKPKTTPAVDGVGFDIRRGECLGLVGESGCGKSMTALALMGLGMTERDGIVILVGAVIGLAFSIVVAYVGYELLQLIP